MEYLCVSLKTLSIKLLKYFRNQWWRGLMYYITFVTYGVKYFVLNFFELITMPNAVIFLN